MKLVSCVGICSILFHCMNNKALFALGVESFADQFDPLQYHRIGLVTNDAAVNFEGRPARQLLLQKGFRICRLFSPEHGIHIIGADGHAQQDSLDALTQLPVISLYGPRAAPEKHQLEDLDLLLFDLPDIGCRFYTYLWTMTYIMEACAQYGKRLIVLDRPNPLGALAETTEGPMLEEKSCSSFIGRYNIPLRHSCTIGELAMLFAATKYPNLDLQVVTMPGYQRAYTGGVHFPFYPTSPAIQHMNTAWLYPGTGLLEGVNVNEGRGTAFPFAQIGAPWMHKNFVPHQLAAFADWVSCSPVSFIAQSPPYAHTLCHGFRMQVISTAGFRPVLSGITLLQALAIMYPHHLTPRAYKTHANPQGENHLDKLLGIPDSWTAIVHAIAINTIVPDDWFAAMEPFWLYK